jgi:hypothetical protein
MSQATIKKHDYIIVKNHPEYAGEIYQVKRVKSDGWAITAEGHLFEPTFFDPVSPWQQHNGGVVRFNSTTGEPVEERNIKKYLLQRLGSDGLDSWVDVEIIAQEMGLSEELIEEWLKNNPESVVRDNNLVRYKKCDRVSEIEEKIEDMSARLAQPIMQKEARLKKRLTERMAEWELALGFKIGSRVVKGDKQGNLDSWSMAGDIIQAMVLWDDSNVVVPEFVKNLKKDKFLDNVPPSDEKTLASSNETSLSLKEKERLHYLESLVETSFVIVGKSLKEIRDRRLYRASHVNFDSYCQAKWNMGRHLANRQIIASDVFENILVTIRHHQVEILNGDNLSPNENGNGDNLSPNEIPLPTKESQLRPIASAFLQSEQQGKAWLFAVNEADGKVPTGKIVQKVVKEMTRPKKENPHKVGDVCKYVGVTGKSGVWCVVSDVKEFSCIVEDYREDNIQVAIDEIESLKLPADSEEFMRSHLLRLQALSDSQDDIVRHTLAFFGKLRSGYLSEAEENMLIHLEILKNASRPAT